jgi:Uma2 family endonuclease
MPRSVAIAPDGTSREEVARLQAGDAWNRYELIAGEIVVSPPCGPDHGRPQARLTEHLSCAARQVGGEAFVDLIIDLPGGDRVAPDVVVVLPGNGGFRECGDHAEGSPDLVVEVLSPTTQLRDRTKKRALYELAGVTEYWLVDRKRHHVEVVRRGEPTPVVFDADEVLSTPLLPSFAVRVRDLFESRRG